MSTDIRQEREALLKKKHEKQIGGGGGNFFKFWNQKMCTSLHTADHVLRVIKILTAAPMFLSYYLFHHKTHTFF